MILPQLENNTHVVDVIGMFFFDDNLFVSRKMSPSVNACPRLRVRKHALDGVRSMRGSKGFAEGTGQCGSGEVSAKAWLMELWQVFSTVVHSAWIKSTDQVITL